MNLIEVKEGGLNWPPHYCAVQPARSEGKFIDTGVDLPFVDPHVYLHSETVREMAEKFCDMVPRSELDDAKEYISQLLVDLEEAREDLAAADKQIQAVEVLESHNFQARKKKSKAAA